MTKLVNAMRTNDSLTANGMTTNSSTLNNCVDLFSMIGAVRGKEKQRKVNAFVKAFEEDALTAMKIMFWVRDVRGGAGERQTAIDLFTYLADNRTDVMRKNLHLIPEYGRWSDVLPFIGTKLETEALELIATGLNAGNGLCAKWMPRPNVKNFDKKRQAKAIRKHLNMTPKVYRKMLVEMSNTVEQLMCSNKWEDIKYSHIPSKAMSDYMKAFGRHDHTGFTAFLDSVTKGEAKINASAVYPYDICKNMKKGDSNGADVQWNALPNYMEGNAERVLPMVDVSGSMSCSAGDNPNVSCMDVAISLGLYISERNEGPFKDAFITFTNNPTLHVLKGTLTERYRQMKGPVGYNTNLMKAFTNLLDKAKASNVPANEMPTMILVLSDMEFDQYGGFGYNATAQDAIDKLYEKAGYARPKLVYWNIHSRNDNNKPVRFDEDGTALVSGFSPALLTGLLGGKDLTPYSMMMNIIGDERYAPVTI